jgi:serine/threonine protein kinase
MGVVWHAHDDLLGRDVAVKEILRPAGMSDEDQQALSRRTVREARAAARLNHPAAVTVFDVIEEAGRPWIVMEFVRARSLAQTIQEDGPLSPREAARAGLQVLAALTAAHAAGILHRDVKPGNVLLAVDGRVVLSDFGIATLEGDAALTAASVVIGSPAYIAPERARGDPAEPASDLWSLGVTLYAAVEGRTPFDRGGPVPTLLAVATEEADPPRRAGPLAPVLQGLLRRNPADRLSAEDTARLLHGVAADLDADTQPSLVLPVPVTDPGSSARRGVLPAAGGSPNVPATVMSAGPPGTSHLLIPGAGGPDGQDRQSPRARNLVALPALAGLVVIGLIAALLIPRLTGGNHPHIPAASPGAAGRASSPAPGTSATRAAGSAGRTPPLTATHPDPSLHRRGHPKPSQEPTPTKHLASTPKPHKSEKHKPPKPEKHKS